VGTNYVVTLADGETVKIENGPDEWADRPDQGEQKAKLYLLTNKLADYDQLYPPTAPYEERMAPYQQEFAQSVEDSGFLQNFRTGYGSGVADYMLGGQQLIGATPGSEATTKRATDSPLMATTGGLLGSIAGKTTSLLPAMAIPGAQGPAGAAALSYLAGALEPASSFVERLGTTALSTATGWLGGKAAQPQVSPGVEQAQRNAPRIAANAAKTQRQTELQQLNNVIRELSDEGFSIPPARAKESQTIKGASYLLGGVPIEQRASQHNQHVVNRLARQSVGLKPKQALSKETLSGIRRNLGEVYREVEEALPDVKFDIELQSAFSQISDDTGQPKVLSDVVDNLLTGDIQPFVSPGARRASNDLGSRVSAKSIMRELKRLRAAAGAHYRAANAPVQGENAPNHNELARANNRAADALESFVERHLPDGDLIERFKDARTGIAKTYTIENAVTETGDVVAHRIRGYTTGELRKIQMLAENFPKAAMSKNQLGATPGFGAFDLVPSLAAVVEPNFLAVTGARIGGREAMANPTVQRQFQKSLLLNKADPSRLSPLLPQYKRPPSAYGLLGSIPARENQ
jgi:hypothetical protein